MIKNSKKVAVVQQVTESLGGWEWAKTKGHYRVLLVDEDKLIQLAEQGKSLQAVHLRSTCPAAEVVYESGTVTFDYPTGKWGYEQAELAARAHAIMATAAGEAEIMMTDSGRLL